MKKSFKLCILILFMTIIIMSSNVNVYATEVDEIADLQSIFASAVFTEQKITLDKNYTLENDVLIFKSGTYELDLNGFNILSNSSHVIIVSGGNLTISNSTSLLGLISSTSDDFFASAVYIDNGSLIINSGKVGDLSNATDVGLYIDGGTTTVNNGEIVGLLHGLYMEQGILTVNEGIFKSTSLTDSSDAIGIYGGNVTINNGNFISSDLPGEGWGFYSENAFESTSIIINNGTFTGSFAGTQFYKESDNDFSVTINNGTFIGNGGGLFLSEVEIPNIEIVAGKFKAISPVDDERFGGIAIEYGTTPPNINDIIKTGSTISSDRFLTDEYTYEDTVYKYIRTLDDIFVGKTITIPDSVHGTIIANKLVALPGDEIFLTITPESGYKFKQMSVVDKFGEMPVTVNNNKFIMPNYNVTIVVEFEKNENYIFTEGENCEFFKSSKSDLKFRINAEYILFDKVYVDNIVLSDNDYTSASGSTIINLKNSYLNTLSEGNHTLNVSFTDGKEVSTIFEIKSVDNPQTGDNIISIMIIFVISLMGILVLIYTRNLITK